MDKRKGNSQSRKTPLRAIRAYCKECVESLKEIRYCTSHNCPLYIYRFGKNPARTGIYPRHTPILVKSRLELANNAKEEGLNA